MRPRGAATFKLFGLVCLLFILGHQLRWYLGSSTACEQQRESRRQETGADLGRGYGSFWKRLCSSMQQEIGGPHSGSVMPLAPPVSSGEEEPTDSHGATSFADLPTGLLPREANLLRKDSSDPSTTTTTTVEPSLNRMFFRYLPVDCPFPTLQDPTFPSVRYNYTTLSLFPRIIYIPNFLSEDEAQHLIDEAQKIGFQRSGVGTTGQKTTAGQKLSRNSFGVRIPNKDVVAKRLEKRAMCFMNGFRKAGCPAVEPTIAPITAPLIESQFRGRQGSMNDSSNISSLFLNSPLLKATHSERWYLLKYEEGQYYKGHSDNFGGIEGLLYKAAKKRWLAEQGKKKQKNRDKSPDVDEVGDEGGGYSANKYSDRAATMILYLRTLPEDGGGESTFPLAMEKEIKRDLQEWEQWKAEGQEKAFTPSKGEEGAGSARRRRFSVMKPTGPSTERMEDWIPLLPQTAMKQRKSLFDSRRDDACNITANFMRRQKAIQKMAENQAATRVTAVNDRSNGSDYFREEELLRFLRVRPQVGAAVVFYNLFPDGRSDSLALHSSCPVRQSPTMNGTVVEKYVATKWMGIPIPFY